MTSSHDKTTAKLLMIRKGLNYKIKLKLNTTPLYRPLYNLSRSELQVLRDYLKTNLALSFIRQLNSLMGALILFIRKKNSSLRLCVNYKSINTIII